MESREYEVMYECEQDHWWYRGLRDLILPIVCSRLSGREGMHLLDAGCGTGANLAALSGTGPTLIGLEFAETAFPFLKRRGLTTVARGTLCRIPFPDESFDAVISTDVLCCIAPPGDQVGIDQMARVLKPGGALLLNLPAYESLRGEHDEAVHTRRRYTVPEITDRVTASGLTVRIATYRNTLLFLPAVLVRLLRALRRKRGAPPVSDVSQPVAPLNWLFERPLKLENRWIQAGGRLPFGLSIFCLATKD